MKRKNDFSGENVKVHSLCAVDDKDVVVLTTEGLYRLHDEVIELIENISEELKDDLEHSVDEMPSLHKHVVHDNLDR